MNLEGVEKTMLLTLYTKAKHSQTKNHKFFAFKELNVIYMIWFQIISAHIPNAQS